MFNDEVEIAIYVFVGLVSARLSYSFTPPPRCFTGLMCEVCSLYCGGETGGIWLGSIDVGK
jgi:hypothetical protein